MGFTPYPSVLNGIDYFGFLYAPADKTLMALYAPADKHPWLTPQGHRLCEPYQNSDKSSVSAIFS
jgi:hypothetical protein